MWRQIAENARNVAGEWKGIKRARVESVSLYELGRRCCDVMWLEEDQRAGQVLATR